MFRHNREFQAGLDQKEARRKREKNALSLRRKDREMKLQKKRKKILDRITPSTATATATMTAGSQQESEQKQRAQMLKDLPRYVQGCFTEHKATIFECTQQIRKLLSFSSNVPIKEVIDSGVVPRLIQFLRWDQCSELQFEAMWILTNIASTEKPEFTSEIVRKGAIPLFVKLLTSPNYSLKEQSMWALGNMAGDCAEIRNLLLENNVLPNILELCKLQFNPNYNLKRFGDKPVNHTSDDMPVKEQFVSLLKNVAWSVSNFCRHPPVLKQYLTPLLECLYYLLQQKMCLMLDDEHNREPYGSNIGWSFAYLLHDISDSDDDVKMLEIMNKTGITKGLIQLLSSHNIPTKQSVLRGVGNILTGNDKYTAKCIDFGVLPQLGGLLKFYYTKMCEYSDNTSNRYRYDPQLKELCWVISNITAGTKQQIIAVIQEEMFPILIHILANTKIIIAQEALWAVSNATSMADSQIIQYLVKENVISNFCLFFQKRFNVNSYNKQSDKILLVSLECIHNILSCDDSEHAFAIEFETNGGCDFLEDLQSNQVISELIYGKVVEIVAMLNDGYVKNQDVLNDDNNNSGIDISCNTNNNNGYSNQFGFGLNRNNDNTNNNQNNNNQNKHTSNHNNNDRFAF